MAGRVISRVLFWDIHFFHDQGTSFEFHRQTYPAKSSLGETVTVETFSYRPTVMPVLSVFKKRKYCNKKDKTNLEDCLLRIYYFSNFLRPYYIVYGLRPPAMHRNQQPDALTDLFSPINQSCLKTVLRHFLMSWSWSWSWSIKRLFWSSINQSIKL